MKMKKIVLALTVVLMGTMVMNAQPPRRHQMSPEKMVEMRVQDLDRQLGLTAEQKAEITLIYMDEMTTMQKEREAFKGESQQPDEATMKTRHEEMKNRHEATDAKIVALLTPEQAAKYAEVKKQDGKRGHHERDRKGMREDGPKRPHHHGKMAPRHEGDCNKDCTCKDKKDDEKK